MNLNGDEFKEKELPTKEKILNYISDSDIYENYTNKSIKFGIQSSPLRIDKNPSFGYFIKNGEILFNDYALGGGDCIQFVSKFFQINYFEALCKIVSDFNLDDKFITKTKSNLNFKPLNNKENILKEKKEFTLHKKSRKWKYKDKRYWSKFNINISLLKEYNVEPVSYIFINNNPVKCDSLAYCYTEFKDNIYTYKIYQPYSKKLKWIANIDDSVWQGWTQLKNKADNLIITKSLKDVMCIKSLYNIEAVSMQAESIKPKNHIIEELKSRFKNIYLLYDNDFNKEENWGRIKGEKLSKEYNLKQIEIPEEYKSTDISELVSNKGKDIAKYFLYNNIKT